MQLPRRRCAAGVRCCQPAPSQPGVPACLPACLPSPPTIPGPPTHPPPRHHHHPPPPPPPPPPSCWPQRRRSSPGPGRAGRRRSGSRLRRTRGPGLQAGSGKKQGWVRRGGRQGQRGFWGGCAGWGGMHTEHRGCQLPPEAAAANRHPPTSVVLCPDLQHLREQLHRCLEVVGLQAAAVGGGWLRAGQARRPPRNATVAPAGVARRRLRPAPPPTAVREVPSTLPTRMHWMPCSNLRPASARTAASTLPVPAPEGPASSAILS